MSLNKLPEDAIHEICSFLDFKSITQLLLVSTTFNSTCLSDSVWKRIYEQFVTEAAYAQLLSTTTTTTLHDNYYRITCNLLKLFNQRFHMEKMKRNNLIQSVQRSVTKSIFKSDDELQNLAKRYAPFTPPCTSFSSKKPMELSCMLAGDTGVGMLSGVTIYTIHIKDILYRKDIHSCCYSIW
jgi:hypothetical protein